MIIRITAKCSDMFSAQLISSGGTRMGQEYDGIVPDWMPGEHYGDYVELDIDPFTGVIKNWKKPSKASMKDTFKFGKPLTTQP